MSVKVEIGFTASGASAPFFTLGDDTLGVLGGTEGLLGGGEILVDVTEYLKSFQITRGKSRDLDKYQAGQATVSFQNDERVFDPTYAAGQYFGQIEPRRQIRITVDDVVQFEGTIDDWNINYDQGGNSVSVAQAFDGFANLANIQLTSFSPSQELSGARVNSALDDIEWPAEKRAIDDGNATLEAQTDISQDILGYLQTIADSEPGELFADKNGNIKFIERNAGFQADRPLFSDDGTGIPYTLVSVIFGTELLFNEVTTTNSTLTASAVNNTSVNLYGKRDLDRATFLSDLTQLENLAEFLSQRFADPEFRFEVLEIDLSNLSTAEREEMINLELGDVVQVKFTPSDIPPAIERFGRVISLSSNFQPTQEIMRIGLQSTQGALFVLGDAEFGKLGGDSGLGF